jgi:peptide/nickel transport system permease protein
MATAYDVTAMKDPVLRERPTGVAAWPGSVWNFCRRKPLGAVGGFIVVAMLLAAVFVDAGIVGSDRPILAKTHYNEQQFGRDNVNQPPSLSNFMGTDQAGRDIFSRILYGARISAVIGFGVVFLASAIAIVFGTLSGYLSGWMDTITQRLVDVMLAIPPLVLLVFAISAFAGRSGPYVRMSWIIIIVAVILAAASTRVVRAATIATAHTPYIDAARTIGANDFRIVFRHIVPNVIPVLIVFGTVNLGTAILAEAAISFLGYGIPDPFPSWGAMLNISGAGQFRVEPLQAVWPGLAIALAVYGYNMLGDALRDVLDPRLRGLG